MGFQINPSWGNSPCHGVSNGRWHVMWFLMVDEILIFEDDKANLHHLEGAADQTKYFILKLKKN